MLNCPEFYLSYCLQISLSSTSDFSLFLQVPPILNTITTQWEKPSRSRLLFLSEVPLFTEHKDKGFSDAFESKTTFLKLLILSEQHALAWRTIWLVWEENLRVAQKEGYCCEDLNISGFAFQTSAKQT